MKCSILQPHYFPWRGYFSIIKNVDEFVFLDDVKFIKREWKNRNKIRKSRISTASKWLTVPIIKNTQNKTLNKAMIDYKEDWQNSHINSLTEVYRKAPQFEKHSEEMFKIIKTKFDYLSDLNISLVKQICKNFKIDTKFTVSSSLHTSGKKDEKLINICKVIGSDHLYANNQSKNYIDEKNFENSKINLEYQGYQQESYVQKNNNQTLDWIGNLSILDLIFNHGFDVSKI